MTDQQTAFERDTDEIAPNVQPLKPCPVCNNTVSDNDDGRVWCKTCDSYYAMPWYLQCHEARALWEAVEVLQSAHHLYYIHANGVGGSRVEVARADICAVAPTLADALIALAARVEGDNQ